MVDMKKVLIENKAVSLSDTRVQIGAFSAPTPTEAKWVFRIITVITTVVAFWVYGTKLIDENIKSEIMLSLKAIDLLVLGITKSLGLVEKE